MGTLTFDNQPRTQRQPCAGNTRQPGIQPVGQAPQHVRHISPMPFDLKVHAFITRMVLQPYRWRRFRMWGMSLYPRTRSFVLTMVGGLVSATIRHERGMVCEGCDRLQVQVPRRAKSNAKWPRYCGSCGCPRWRLSRLSFKNRFRAAYCPLRKHAGPYPDDWWRRQVEGLEKQEQRHDTS